MGGGKRRIAVDEWFSRTTALIHETETPMNLLFQAGLELQEFLQERKWPFCFIGGLAVIRWGEIRMTQDIDLSLFTGFGGEKNYIDGILSNFASRITDAEDFALRNRVLLITASNGVSVDISLAGLPFEEEMIERATSYEFNSDCKLMTCSVEDLVVLKAFVDRMKDWADIEGIMIRQHTIIDLDYIIERLTPLCELKEAPEILEKLRFLMNRN